MKRLFASVAAVALATTAAPAFGATIFVADLRGASENPPAATPATGSAFMSLDGDMLNVSITFQGLTTGLADGHIHCCVGPAGNAGVAIGFGGLPLGSLAGTYSRSFDLSIAATYRTAYLNASGGTAAGARARLLNAFATNLAYVNLHTTQFPGGEIRGQVAAVPEPATWGMMLVGFGLAGVAIRSRQRRALAA